MWRHIFRALFLCCLTRASQREAIGLQGQAHSDFCCDCPLLLSYCLPSGGWNCVLIDCSWCSRVSLSGSQLTRSVSAAPLSTQNHPAYEISNRGVCQKSIYNTPVQHSTPLFFALKVIRYSYFIINSILCSRYDNELYPVVRLLL